jgi:hypothetical protein
MLEGLFSGVAAGQMGGGDTRGGLKYSILLALTAVLMFEWVLMPMGPPAVAPQE